MLNCLLESLLKNFLALLVPHLQQHFRSFMHFHVLVMDLNRDKLHVLVVGASPCLLVHFVKLLQINGITAVLEEQISTEDI